MMCGLTKLGTNVVTMAMVKERNNLCIHDIHFGFHFQDHTLDNLVHSYLTVISFYDHTCDHARVISKISFRVHLHIG